MACKRSWVRLPLSPLGYIESYIAGVAQLVEHQLPKLRVAGSSPVSRSKGSAKAHCPFAISTPFLLISPFSRDVLPQERAPQPRGECGNSLYKVRSCGVANTQRFSTPRIFA